MHQKKFAALGFIIGYFIYDSTTEGESTSVAVEVINLEKLHTSLFREEFLSGSLIVPTSLNL